MDSFERISEFLFSELNIYVSGACGPKREEPIQCFRPVHQTYHRPAAPSDHPLAANIEATLPGGSLRMERAFEWAIGQEMVGAAIETFVDSQQSRALDATNLLRKFGEFLDTLGLEPHPVAVSVSDLVAAMLESYAHVTNGLGGFSWECGIEAAVEEFVYTRECFFFPPNRRPVLKAAFTVTGNRQDELDVDLHFAWNAPVLQFGNLRNVISEGETFSFKPSFDVLPHSADLRVTEEYFLGAQDNWLNWDAEQGLFHGKVPRRLAAHVGAERFESYTTPLELTARISQSFPGNMRFERVIRCALPITVRRRPTTCSTLPESLTSPAIPRPTASRLLQRQVLIRSPLRRACPGGTPPPPMARTQAVNNRYGCDIEATQLSTAEVAKLLAHKARSSNQATSPTKLNPLSLARLNDAIALAHPTPLISHLTEVEVRPVYNVRHGPIRPSRSMRQVPPTPCESTVLDEALDGLNLGSTHVNRRGDLASRSESDQEEQGPHDSVNSRPTRNITPPPPSASVSPRKQGKLPLMDPWTPSKTPAPLRPVSGVNHESHSRASESVKPNSGLTPFATSRRAPKTCCTCEIASRKPRIAEIDGVQTCLTCEEHSVHRWVDNIYESGSRHQLKEVGKALSTVLTSAERDSVMDRSNQNSPAKEGSEERTVDKWQLEINENFHEFMSNKENEVGKLDITMDDALESGEELSGFSEEL